jgi:hypothetical protein
MISRANVRGVLRLDTKVCCLSPLSFTRETLYSAQETSSLAMLNVLDGLVYFFDAASLTKLLTGGIVLVGMANPSRLQMIRQTHQWSLLTLASWSLFFAGHDASRLVGHELDKSRAA